MYPYLRFAYHVTKARRAPRLGLFETNEIETRIWPQDLDPWRELNNGRTLTLYDLGRISMFLRIGWSDVMQREGWGGTVAGASVRYRKRVTLLQKVSLRSRIVGWDHRFVYMVQGMWVGDDCTSQALMRTAIIENRRMVPTERVAAAMAPGAEPVVSPDLPDWVSAWIAAEDMRPWPPAP